MLLAKTDLGEQLPALKLLVNPWTVSWYVTVGRGIGLRILITKFYRCMNGLLLKAPPVYGSVNTMCLHGYGENSIKNKNG